MPPETLPIDRKPSASEPVEIVPPRWRDSPTTPSSQYNNRGSPSSYRWGGGGGGYDVSRPFTGHGKPGLPVFVDSGNQKDLQRGNFRATSASSNGNSHPQSDFVNHWDQLQLNDQHAKSSGDGVSATGDQRLEKAVSLGSSLDWKPIKWIRSGSLSSRGSGFSHLSSCKVVGVDPVDTKMDTQLGSGTLLQSPSGDASTCVTPNTPDEANSRKKARLGWGEGLAKYEKKKVDPDDIIDKENGPRNGIVNGVSNLESLLPSSSIPGNSESASPVTSCSVACSLSPGLEEKTPIVETLLDNDSCNPGVSLSPNHTLGLPFNLENFDLAEDINLSSLLDQLLQTDATIVPRSGFAMDKLQVWKEDISRTIEVAESEIDSLEHELKSLMTEKDPDPRPVSCDSSFVLKQCKNKNIVDIACLDTISEKAECSKSLYLGRDDKLYDSILAANKDVASRAVDELSKLLPTTNLCTDITKSTDDSLIKKRISSRKRFLKFKERVVTLKFRTFQYSWKESLRLISLRSGSKSHKKFESSSRLGYLDSQKHRVSSHSRSSTPGGCSRLVPTEEVVDYVSKLLLDSRVKIYRNEQKMPTFILDNRERTSSKFISDNGLVENPADVEKERAVVNSWTEEDKQMFLNQYALFGKNFRKIASLFRHKTVADCVEYYYKNHKSESFQNIKKNLKSAKGKSCVVNANSTYLVTHGKRPNRETGATSLDMLGAASAMVANVNERERSNDFTVFCNERETVAADVLAGICGSISSEALGSCVTSSVDYQKLGRSSLNNVDEETCSDESCGEDVNSSIWTDEERGSFVKAVKTYGKDFSMVSRCMGTRSSDECKVFFSKVKKCFGLDAMDLVGSEGLTGGNQGGGDHDDACMVDSGSGISNEKSLIECKVDVEEQAESDQNAPNNCRESELVVESPQNACSDSASGAKVEEPKTVNSDSFHGTTLDLNAENATCQEANNGFITSNLFPQDPVPPRKTVSSQDDVSSRLTFRKSGQRSSSIDGLNLHKRSLSSNEPQSKLNLDESLLLPIDGCIQTGTDFTHPRRSSSLEKPSNSGDVKLFGQIITNRSLPKSNDSQQENEKPEAGKSFNLKFDHGDLQLKRNYGFWDRNIVQTGYSSLPGSAVLLAKYPAAFSNISTLPNSSVENGNEQCNGLNVVSGFQTRKLTNTRGPSYHAYGQSFTVDKLLPEMPGGACNGVSDPVAAIRMHYAKTEQYKNGGNEPWRSNVSDIGSR